MFFLFFGAGHGEAVFFLFFFDVIFSPIGFNQFSFSFIYMFFTTVDGSKRFVIVYQCDVKLTTTLVITLL